MSNWGNSFQEPGCPAIGYQPGEAEPTLSEFVEYLSVNQRGAVAVVLHGMAVRVRQLEYRLAQLTPGAPVLPRPCDCNRAAGPASPAVNAPPPDLARPGRGRGPRRGRTRWERG